MSDETMSELIRRARKESKWFRILNRWYSPSELEAEQQNGRMNFPPYVFRLRNPQEHVDYLRDKVSEARQAVEQFEERIRNAKA